MADSDLTADYFTQMGYLFVRQLPSGVWLGIEQMLYTGRLFYGLDHTGWSRCWDYADVTLALEAMLAWDGEGDHPPGPWIKRKPDEVWGPGAPLGPGPNKEFVK